MLINFGPDHLKILWETATTLPKLSCTLGLELPLALSALQVVCVSCLCYSHPKVSAVFLLVWDDWKETKICRYVTEHLGGRSVVSTGVSAAHLRNKYDERGCACETLRTVGLIPPLDLLGADKPISGSLVLLLSRTLLGEKALEPVGS